MRGAEGLIKELRGAIADERVLEAIEAVPREAFVPRGLRSRAYDTGRLSVRREAGEQLFHQLLHADLKAGALRR